MRYILIAMLAAALGTNAFAQLNSAETADGKTVSACFSKAVIIVPSARIDPLIIIEPSEKFDAGMLVEILCPSDFSIKKPKKTIFL